MPASSAPPLLSFSLSFRLLPMLGGEPVKNQASRQRIPAAGLHGKGEVWITAEAANSVSASRDSLKT